MLTRIQALIVIPEMFPKVSPPVIFTITDRRKTYLKSKQIPVKSGSELMADPVKCVFGYTATSEEIHDSTPSSMSSREERRANQRRRRAHMIVQ
ncbi:hypothetical protein V6N13_053589 [Hibiscus sabdariffa]|uniref:Uncharacterized protein n=1 Tax=Hibiscus sabdariffa TaxID=183260 RepID=A0ABR2T7S9_9ROSI